MCQVADFKHLKMTQDYRTTLELELEMWHQAYLPVKGTVLDVGAGCGETAAFYLNHGARKVICIECDPVALEHLRYNFGIDPRVQIIEAKINNIKIDIEGAERDMVFETHFPVTFAKMWSAPAPARDVHLWKLKSNGLLEATRAAQDALHNYRIRIAHRIRLVLNKLS